MNDKDKQFWATIIAQLQSDRYWSGYFYIKIFSICRGTKIPRAKVLVLGTLS